MKKIALLLFFILISQKPLAQNFYIKTIGNNKSETKTLDSIGYQIKHRNAKLVQDESLLLLKKANALGYIESEITQNSKINDSVFLFNYTLGPKTNKIHVYLNKDSKLIWNNVLNYKKDTLILPFIEIESFLNSTLEKLEQKGYPLAKIKLLNLRTEKKLLFAELALITDYKRTLNDIVINGYDQFPKGHQKNILKSYKNKILNQENVKKIHVDFEKFRFVTQTKYPEILFTKDTSKVYVYVEKSKSNKFDGFVGFSNNEKGKLKFNGYLDLLLTNIVNRGETFSLYWKSDGEDQKTFNTGIELPYIFKSPFGLKSNINFFKQDSTFQNTKTNIDIGYFINYTTRLYLGYQSTESSDIQNQNNFNLSDYKNSFLTTNFEYRNFNQNKLFPEKTNLNTTIGFGSRQTIFSSNKQFFCSVLLKHLFFLNEKNHFQIVSQTYYLNSDHYITNELFRFGGVNSIRGFRENSLQANVSSSIITEYRYQIASNFYIHTILDYGFYTDTTTQSRNKLMGLGFGSGIATKNGIINLIYANGTTSQQILKLSNSLFHISFKTTF